MIRPLYEEVRLVFSDYYRVLEEGLREAQTAASDQQLRRSILARIHKAADTFWHLPGFVHIADRDNYFRNIQERLHREGYYLDMTPQYGVDTGELEIATVDNISVRPILQQRQRQARSGSRVVEYSEFVLGKNLIEPPEFLQGIVESASTSEVAIFIEDLYQSLLDDYEVYLDFKDEADRRYQEGAVSADGLFCVQLRLHQRQWGKDRPGTAARDRLIEHFRLHGEQHVVDLVSVEAGTLTFPREEAGLTEALNRDMLLEARVLLRQMLEQSLPFYTLGQVISFEREWMDGSRSEYAWAGHVLFPGFIPRCGCGTVDGVSWGAGAEPVTEAEISRLAVRCAKSRTVFGDLLTAD